MILDGKLIIAQDEFPMTHEVAFELADPDVFSKLGAFFRHSERKILHETCANREGSRSLRDTT